MRAGQKYLKEEMRARQKELKTRREATEASIEKAKAGL
jgi:hypothetical protein